MFRSPIEIKKYALSGLYLYAEREEKLYRAEYNSPEQISGTQTDLTPQWVWREIRHINNGEVNYQKRLQWWDSLESPSLDDFNIVDKGDPSLREGWNCIDTLDAKIDAFKHFIEFNKYGWWNRLEPIDELVELFCPLTDAPLWLCDEHILVEEFLCDLVTFPRIYTIRDNPQHDHTKADIGAIHTWNMIYKLTGNEKRQFSFSEGPHPIKRNLTFLGEPVHLNLADYLSGGYHRQIREFKVFARDICNGDRDCLRLAGKLASSIDNLTDAIAHADLHNSDIVIHAFEKCTTILDSFYIELRLARFGTIKGTDLNKLKELLDPILSSQNKAAKDIHSVKEKTEGIDKNIKSVQNKSDALRKLMKAVANDVVDSRAIEKYNSAIIQEFLTKVKGFKAAQRRARRTYTSLDRLDEGLQMALVDLWEKFRHGDLDGKIAATADYRDGRTTLGKIKHDFDSFFTHCEKMTVDYVNDSGKLVRNYPVSRAINGPQAESSFKKLRHRVVAKRSKKAHTSQADNGEEKDERDNETDDNGSD